MKYELQLGLPRKLVQLFPSYFTRVLDRQTKISFFVCDKLLKLCIRFLSNLCKNDLNTVLGRNLFSIANDCSVNLSDLSKMLVKKQMKYFDVPFWTMHGNMYVMSNDQCRLFDCITLHFFLFFYFVKLYI